jgi:hypothetical protein
VFPVRYVQKGYNEDKNSDHSDQEERDIHLKSTKCCQMLGFVKHCEIFVASRRSWANVRCNIAAPRFLPYDSGR